MFNKKMYELGADSSVIRALHGLSEQRRLAGEEVYDFTIGDPCIPTPKAATDIMKRLIDSGGIHSYTASVGREDARKAVADGLIRRGVPAESGLIYLCCGAAAGLAIALKAIVEEGDNVIIFAPYFSEYAVYVQNAGAKVVVAPFDKDMLPDLNALKKLITPRTKAVIVNSPNNPSGAVYGRDILQGIADILSASPSEIYLISDEPYREIVYDREFVSPAAIYKNTLTCYSYSKSLSLPGERIGYLSVSPLIPCAKELMLAIDGAGRALGYVCAPSLMQGLIAEADGISPDIAMYRQNRDLLYNELSAIGYQCIRPDGAFYLTVRALEEDSEKFALNATGLNLFIVPLDSFGARGYVRIAYCVSPDIALASIPRFKELYKLYKG